MDVSIRDAMLAASGALMQPGILHEIDVKSFELEVGPDLNAPAWPLHLGGARSARDAERGLRFYGNRASAVLVGNDFASDGASESHIGWVVRAVEVAAKSKAPVIRIDPLARDKSVSPADAAANFINGVREVLDATRGINVDLGIENHGPLANDPAWLDAVLAELNDPRVGLTLDTGNFFWFGFPLDEVYGLIEKYAPLVKHTHIKSINYPSDAANRRREIGWEYKQYCCPLDEGNLDLRRVVKILRDAGYDRDLCIEDESLFKYSPQVKLDVLKRNVQALRAAM